MPVIVFDVAILTIVWHRAPSGGPGVMGWVLAPDTAADVAAIAAGSSVFRAACLLWLVFVTAVSISSWRMLWGPAGDGRTIENGFAEDETCPSRFCKDFSRLNALLSQLRPGFSFPRIALHFP